MLRLTLVFSIILLGALYSLKGPFYVLLFYLWNAYFTPEHWVWDGDIITALSLSFWLGVVLVATTPFSSARFRFDRRVLVMMLFLGHCALSAAYSEHHAAVWPEFEQFFRIMVVSYLMIALLTDSRRFGLVLLTISLSLGLEAAKQGWVHMLLHPGAVNNNQIRFLGDNNGVAVGMLMLAPLIIVSGQFRKTKGVRNGFKFLAVGVVFRSLTTYSRGGLLAGGVLAATYLARSRGRRIITAALAVAAVGAVVLTMLPEQYWDRMATIFTWSEEESASARMHFWRVAASMAEEHPFRGVGFGAFSFSYDEFDTSEGEYGSVRACHSSWFAVLSELGVVGLALFVTLFVCGFNTCRRIIALVRDHPDNRELQDIGRYAVALRYSLVAFVVGGSFVSLQYNEMLWHLLSLTIALDALARKAALEGTLEAAEPSPEPETRGSPAESPEGDRVDENRVPAHVD